MAEVVFAPFTYRPRLKFQIILRDYDLSDDQMKAMDSAFKKVYQVFLKNRGSVKNCPQRFFAGQIAKELGFDDASNCYFATITPMQYQRWSKWWKDNASELELSEGRSMETNTV